MVCSMSSHMNSLMSLKKIKPRFRDFPARHVWWHVWGKSALIKNATIIRWGKTQRYQRWWWRLPIIKKMAIKILHIFICSSLLRNLHLEWIPSHVSISQGAKSPAANGAVDTSAFPSRWRGQRPRAAQGEGSLGTRKFSQSWKEIPGPGWGFGKLLETWVTWAWNMGMHRIGISWNCIGEQPLQATRSTLVCANNGDTPNISYDCFTWTMYCT